jgi:hypothetical protein
MSAVDERPVGPDRAEAQLCALLPQLPVARVFRTSDGGESWTASDVDTVVTAFTEPGPATGR